MLRDPAPRLQAPASGNHRKCGLARSHVGTARRLAGLGSPTAHPAVRRRVRSQRGPVTCQGKNSLGATRPRAPGLSPAWHLGSEGALHPRDPRSRSPTAQRGGSHGIPSAAALGQSRWHRWQGLGCRGPTGHSNQEAPSRRGGLVRETVTGEVGRDPPTSAPRPAGARPDSDQHPASHRGPSAGGGGAGRDASLKWR